MRTTSQHLHGRPHAVVRALWVAAILALVLAACSGGENAEPAATASEGTEAGDGSTEAESPAGGDDVAAMAAEACDSTSIRVVIPYSSGGGFDTYGRGIVPHLRQQLPDWEIAPENRPGGGGMIGANQVFLDQEGGEILIGLINFPGAVFAAATGSGGVEFDNAEWKVLGRVAAVNPLIYTSEGSGLASADDIVNAEDPVTFGLGGVGSDAFYGTHIIGRSFDFPYEIITGYEGGAEADAALVAEEVEARFQSLDSAIQVVEAEGAVPAIYVASERNDRIPDVPTVVELATNPDQETVMSALASIYDLERIFVTSPNVPDGCVDALGQALIAAMESEGFQSDMEEAGRTLAVLGPDETQQLAETAVGGFDQLEPLLEDIDAG